jgi:HSP20 family protein
MNITKFKPGRNVFQDSLTPFSAFFDSFINDAVSKEEHTNFFRPAVDVKEIETAFELAFSLPGIEKEEVKVELKDNRLTVSGERKKETEEKNTRFHRVEHYYGNFSRSFMLPENIKSDAIEANFKNGVLTVAIPKAEAVQPKTIEIK